MNEPIFKHGVSEFVKSIINVSKTYGFKKAFRRSICIFMQKIVGPPRGELLITTRNGYRMFLIPHDRGISTELRTFKVHEPLTTKILIKELKEGMIVVDVGSNIGYYVILGSKLVGKKGMVVAIEPIPTNFRYLLLNIKTNHLSNVKTFNVALSEREGIIKMINDNYSNWSRVLSNEDQTIKPIKIEEVKATTGDILLESIDNIGLIRMDVEGHEDYIIKGCREVIRKWLPDILIEVHSSLLGVERLQNLLYKFKQNGYLIKYLIPRDLDFLLVANDENIEAIDINKLIISPITWGDFTLFMQHSLKFDQ